MPDDETKEEAAPTEPDPDDPFAQGASEGHVKLLDEAIALRDKLAAKDGWTKRRVAQIFGMYHAGINPKALDLLDDTQLRDVTQTMKHHFDNIE